MSTWSMTRSQFLSALESVYGPSFGHTLAADLVLPGLGVTAFVALDEGIPPQEIWLELLRETDKSVEVYGFPQRAAKRVQG
ncbi:MAG: DUF3046 domain-containing protein [Actinomycetaceae bacterium]|nr:DUF3046 domain-containing protein [Actinomycetaceae bacterium]